MFLLLRIVPVWALFLIAVVAFVTYAATNQPAWLVDPARDLAETALERAGAGVVTGGLWLLAVLILLVKKPVLLVKKWRLVIGTSLLVTAIQGGLSYFEAELPLIGVADFGGTLGQEAQGSNEWLAYVRIGAVAAFGVWFLLPAISNKLMRGTGKGAGATAVGAVRAYRFAPLHRGVGKVVAIVAKVGFALAKGGAKGGFAVAKGGASVAKGGGGVVVRGGGAAVGAAREARAGRRDDSLRRELEGFFAESPDAPFNRLLPPATDDRSPFLRDANADLSSTAPYIIDDEQPEVVTPAEIITPPPETKRPPRKARVVDPEEPELPVGRPVAIDWRLPDISSLSLGVPSGAVTEEHHATAGVIEETLAQHGVEVSVAEIKPGPSVTMFGLVPGWNRRARPGGRARGEGPEETARNMFTEARSRVKVDSILAREKDLALALAAPSLRLQAPVPGESIVGVEVPNKASTTVMIRRIMDSDEYHEVLDEGGLPVALGLASAGEPVVIDLLKMPHLLIAGATGSGKSVCMNSIISSLIAHQSPSRVRMMLVDPKRVELTPYNGVPHLVTPVVTEPDRVVRLLRGAIQEMSRRYRLLEEAGVRNIVSYNRSPKATEDMPYFVICIDELADLMMTASFEVEQGICRLAQLGRATGIHLVVATQRPSVDVVTGLIKANFPSRIAFAVASQVDSRTIIDTNGAERLLGRGDMLYLSPDSAKARRVQGVLTTEEETDVLADHWRAHPPRPLPEVSLEDMARQAEMAAAVKEEAEFDETDSLYDKALAVAAANRQLSTSLLQRKLRIGYPRAARLMDQLQEEGIVGGSTEPGKPRDVIYLPDDQN
jgi:S-DNA-T family DNA segregation ATPase FtsK/SpoIIIE